MSSIWMSCSMPIISSSPPGGCGFIACFKMDFNTNFVNFLKFLLKIKAKSTASIIKINFNGIDWKRQFLLTFSCSAKLYACFSASRARLSFSFNEKMATDRALLMRLCFTRDFFAANSAAIELIQAKLLL